MAEFPPSGKILLAFKDAADFRQRFEAELGKGTFFFPCTGAPAPGCSVEVTVRVPVLGDAEVNGVVARHATTAKGQSGAVITFPPERVRSLYDKAEGALAPGDILDGRFRIEGHLASGGMGEVYRATHMFLKRPVAVKLLHRAFANDARMAARFQREAELVSQLESPNVVRVLDFGRTAGGLLFLAMEFVEGEPLDTLLVRENLAPERAVLLLGQICEGLSEAHERGIVHRDLKPANIMIAERRGGGEIAKVLDFGIARLADGAVGEGVTQAGMIVGTPAYIAPEQALAGEIDARTDLYSLGVMAFEMLAGRRPFENPEVQKLLSMQLVQPPPHPSEVNPALRELPALCGCVLRLLAKRRDDRFPDARSFAKAIAEALAQDRKGGKSVDLPLPAPPPPRPAGVACPRCATVAAPGAAFCASCGASVAAGCPRCGAPSTAGAAFCHGCGGALTPGPVAAARTPPSPAPRAQAPRPIPPALVDALSALQPSLDPEEVRELVAARALLRGPGSGNVLAFERLGAEHLSQHAVSAEEASAAARRSMARIVRAGALHGGVLDWLDLDSATFLFPGAEPQRAIHAALHARDAIAEERARLDKAPLAVRAALCSGAFDARPDGAPAEGAAVDGARALLGDAAPGGILLDAACAAGRGPRIEARELEPGRWEASGVLPAPVPSVLSLVGRAAELHHFEEALAGGNARAFVITGEPGSGRTRLLEDLAARARRQGFAVAFVRPRRAQPFGIAASLAGELCGVADGGRLDTVRAAIESARLPPGDAGAALALTGASFMPPGFTPGHAAAALQALVRAALQQRPVLIAVDHADRADAESLEALRLVVARRQPRCVVAASASAGVFGDDDQLRLGPLAATDAEARARERLGGPPPPELLSRAAGNPRALIDLGLLWLETAALPALSPARLAAARVETSGPMARRLLEAGAVLGDPFDASTAEAALLDEKQKPGKGDPRAQAAWARLERTLVLRAIPGRRFTFVDGLVRAAALARSEGATRIALHRRLAEAWKARVLDLGAVAAAEVGRHLSAAGDSAAAAPWWERAAEASLQRRDFRGAAARLVQHGGQAQLARASALLFAAGDLRGAREAADQALAATGEAADAAEAAISSARCLRQEGQKEEAARALTSISAGAGALALVLARVEAGEQLEAAGNAAAARKRYEEALGQAQTVQHLARWHGEIDLRSRIELRLGAILAAQGDSGAAAAAFEQARDGFEKAAHPWGAARALANMGALAAQAGRYPDAIRRYQDAAQAASAAGDLAFAVRQLGSLAKAQRLSGDLARARATARDAEQLARDLAWPEGVKLAVSSVQAE